jgi:hypothetical protein
MASTPIWHRLATLGIIIGILLFLGDLAILGRFAYFLGQVLRNGAGLGPTLGG